MLDLPDPLFISPSLHGFMAVVRCVKLEFPVGWSIGVEYPYVQKCSLVPVAPEAVGTDVESGSIFCVGGGERK